MAGVVVVARMPELSQRQNGYRPGYRQSGERPLKLRAVRNNTRQHQDVVRPRDDGCGSQKTAAANRDAPFNSLLHKKSVEGAAGGSVDPDMWPLGECPPGKSPFGGGMPMSDQTNEPVSHKALFIEMLRRIDKGVDSKVDLSGFQRFKLPSHDTGKLEVHLRRQFRSFDDEIAQQQHRCRFGRVDLEGELGA